MSRRLLLGSPRLPWARGLTSTTGQVGKFVCASGVPLKGGLAHHTPETFPIQYYSAWALQPHLQGRELQISYGQYKQKVG